MSLERWQQARCDRCGTTERWEAEQPFILYDWLQIAGFIEPVSVRLLCPACAALFREWMKNGRE